jgi:hypothetical protein
MRRVLDGRKHPDLREGAFPSRGGAETRVLVGSGERRELQPFDMLGTGDHGVLGKFTRRGTFIHLVMRRCMARRGEVLRSGRLGSRVSSLSFQPVALAKQRLDR